MLNKSASLNFSVMFFATSPKAIFEFIAGFGMGKGTYRCSVQLF